MITCGWCKFDIPHVGWDEHVKKCRATKGRYGVTLFTTAYKESASEWIRQIELKNGLPVETGIQMIVSSKPYDDMFDLFGIIQDALAEHGVRLCAIHEDASRLRVRKRENE